MMMISSTPREGVSAGLGRDDVRTVTVVARAREPCPRAPLLPIFPPRTVCLETGGKQVVRVSVIDGNELICCPGTSKLAVGTQISIGEKKEEYSAAADSPRCGNYLRISYSLI